MRKLVLFAVSAASLGAAPLAAQQDSAFAVSRAGASLLRVNVDGNVGIGNSSPTQRLTVAGGVQADSATVGQLRFTDGSGLPTARITPIALPYAAGWGNLPAPNAPARYYRDPFGIVHLTGIARYTGATSSSVVLMTLPAGFRPSGDLLVAVPNPNQLPSYLRIYADGTVRAEIAGSSLTNGILVWLDGVSFLGEQ